MAKAKSDGGVNHEPVHTQSVAPVQEPVEAAPEGQGDIVATAAAVVVVGAGVAVFEAALLPGVVLGVAAMLAPRVLPNLGAAINPLFRSTVRGAVKLGQKTKEMVAEAQEHVNDIVAEVHAEGEATPAPTNAAGNVSATPAG